MTRAVIVARVSTEKQASALRHSLGTQEENGRGICARQGWDIDRVFAIPGESAYVDDLSRRPEFGAAVDYAIENRVDVVLVQELSRFARSFVVGWTVIHRLRQAGIRLLDFNLTDYTEDEDRAVFDLWAARRSSRDHSHRVLIGVRKQFERGLPVGDIPFGYRRVMVTDARGAVVPDTTQPPIVVPEEAEAIRWLFRAYLAGAGYLAMVDELNRRGLRPRSKRRKLAGTVLAPREEFAVTSVQRILENPFYAGWVTHHGERTRGRHEPVISEETFAAAQSRKTGARRLVPQTRQLLSGIALCRVCGKSINCQRSDHRYYYRERPRGGVECVNVRGALRADAVHRQVEDVIAAIAPHNDPRFLAYVNAQARRREGQRTVSARESLEAERKRVLALSIKGHITAEETDAMLADVACRLSGLPPERGALDVMVQRMRDFADVWARADEGDRFEAVRILLRSVRLDVRAPRVEDAIAIDPWPDYEPLFAFRREYVTGLRPGGLQRRAVTGSLYLPAELVS